MVPLATPGGGEPWRRRSLTGASGISLALREAELLEECVTTQGIPLRVRAVAVFKDNAGRMASLQQEQRLERQRGVEDDEKGCHPTSTQTLICWSAELCGMAVQIG